MFQTAGGAVRVQGDNDDKGLSARDFGKRGGPKKVVSGC